MKTIRVEEIMLPLTEEIPPHPFVKVGDRVSYAIELMAKNNRNKILVLKNNHPVGILHLKEALKKLGLHLEA